jgi:hypothetical protein
MGMNAVIYCQDCGFPADGTAEGDDGDPRCDTCSQAAADEEWETWLHDRTDDEEETA